MAPIIRRSTSTTRAAPLTTIPRSGAHSEQELIEALKVQLFLEFEINHGAELRELKGVWEPPVDTTRVASEVLHPVIERAIKQSCAWCRTDHKRTTRAAVLHHLHHP